MTLRLLPALAVLALTASPVLAAPSIEAPWIRATPPGAITAAGYMTLRNPGPAADRLMGGSSPVAKNLTVHQTVVSKGISRMSATPSLAIAPGQAIAFKPGGYHLMLVGLTGPLTVGQVVPVTLNFQKAGAVTVRFTVQQAPAPMPAATHDGHHMH